VFLVRLALLDRTVQIEELISQLGGSESNSPAGAPSTEPQPTRRAAPPPPPQHAEPPPSPAPQSRRMSPPTAMDSAVPRSTTPSADQPRSVAPNEPERREAPPAKADLETVKGTWDGFRTAVRREKPVLATFVDKASPASITSAGALLLDVPDVQARESLQARINDLSALARAQFNGIRQVLIRESAGSIEPVEAAARMTPSSIRSETMAALRKRNPMLNAAIDELDLELLD
jgi:hypothetical protein